MSVDTDVWRLAEKPEPGRRQRQAGDFVATFAADPSAAAAATTVAAGAKYGARAAAALASAAVAGPAR